jgi:hypothetical protein
MEFVTELMAGVAKTPQIKKTEFFYQLMHHFLENNMLKFTLKYYTVASTCFGLL